MTLDLWRLSMYDYEHNLLKIKVKTGVEIELQMRGRITIVSGQSATGKTFICDYISTIQRGMNDDNEYDNVFVLNMDNKDKIFNQHDKLVMIDRADMILTSDIADFINQDRNNKYLIFARGITGIRITPNYVATIERDENKVWLKYKFNREGWF